MVGGRGVAWLRGPKLVALVERKDRYSEMIHKKEKKKKVSKST